MEEAKQIQSPAACSPLSEGEEMLQIISSAARDAIIMIDHEGKVTYWNKAADDMFGYASGEILGKNLHLVLVPESMHQAYEKEFALFRETGQGQAVGKILELPAMRKDGLEIPVEFSVSSVMKQGQWHALSIVRDITERRRMEEELKRHRDHLGELVREQTTELRRSYGELQQFAYVASHDMQEPLRMITSYLQLLEKRYQDKLDDDARDFITYAVDGASRLQELINSLLLYSRVGTWGKPFEPTNVEAVFGQAMNNLERAIAESGAVVTREDLPALMADSGQLIQLFQNLIANAIKFCSDVTPQIHIGVKPEKGDWLFSVHDNGLGFDMKDGERIFGVFQRLHTRQEYPGTGIGLAIARKIVERHGGRIWAEAEPGKGATFFFTLPMGG